MRVVLDTNVLVSAQLSPYAPPAQVVRLALQGDLTSLYDDRVLAEYGEVLRRPRFGFDPEDVRAVIEGIEKSGEAVFTRPLSVMLTDPDDLPFLEVAAAGLAYSLITGNLRHYEPLRGSHHVTVLSPRDFLNRLTD